MRFYHVTVQVTPLYCRTNTHHFVISEDPLDFVDRNKSVKRHGGTWNLVQYREIERGRYSDHRPNNPKEPNRKYQVADTEFCNDDWSECIEEHIRCVPAAG